MRGKIQDLQLLINKISSQNGFTNIKNIYTKDITVEMENST